MRRSHTQWLFYWIPSYSMNLHIFIDLHFTNGWVTKIPIDEQCHSCNCMQFQNGSFPLYSMPVLNSEVNCIHWADSSAQLFFLNVWWISGSSELCLSYFLYLLNILVSNAFQSAHVNRFLQNFRLDTWRVSIWDTNIYGIQNETKVWISCINTNILSKHCTMSMLMNLISRARPNQLGSLARFLRHPELA